MSSKLAFFDTNIFLYAEDTRYPEKRAIALRLVEKHMQEGTLAVSLQVLQEYFAAATRKLGLPAPIAQRKVSILAAGHVVRITETDLISAIELHRLHQVSFWDALVVQAARLIEASVLYSEDMQDGAVIAGVPIVNPFRVGHGLLPQPSPPAG